MTANLHNVRTGVKLPAAESAPYAAQVGGILRRMAAKNQGEQGRGLRLPVGHGDWWPVRAREAALARAKRLGIRPPGTRSLRDEVIKLGVDVTEDKVGRALSGDVVTWEIADALSTVLEIPPPAQLPRNADEAEMVAMLLAKLRSIR